MRWQRQNRMKNILSSSSFLFLSLLGMEVAEDCHIKSARRKKNVQDDKISEFDLIYFPSFSLAGLFAKEEERKGWSAAAALSVPPWGAIELRARQKIVFVSENMWKLGRRGRFFFVTRGEGIASECSQPPFLLSPSRPWVCICRVSLCYLRKNFSALVKSKKVFNWKCLAALPTDLVYFTSQLTDFYQIPMLCRNWKTNPFFLYSRCPAAAAHVDMKYKQLFLSPLFSSRRCPRYRIYKSRFLFAILVTKDGNKHLFSSILRFTVHCKNNAKIAKVLQCIFWSTEE